VRRLRGKLGSAGQRLRTVRGIGYRLDTGDASEEN
jgi:DNA-binding response OmpR family regulator